MEAPPISLIMEKLDKMVTEDRSRNYSNALIMKIIVILNFFDISYRSSRMD